MHRRVKPAKLLPHTAHRDWINRTGLTSWAFTRWCDRHTSDNVAHYSIYRPRKDERLSRPGWLVTYRNKVPPPGVEPRHVTHPSTNRAWRRVTSLIRPTPLPLRHAANHMHYTCIIAVIVWESWASKRVKNTRAISQDYTGNKSRRTWKTGCVCHY